VSASLVAALAGVAHLCAPNDGEGFEFAPAELVHAPYVADPRRSVLSLSMNDVSDVEIADAGDTRWYVRIGGRFPIVRYTSASAHVFQVEGEVGFNGLFDRDDSADNLGWDGVYAFDLAWAPNDELSLRVGLAHASSHIGDEYIEETGATRIGYTREELRFGASWDFAKQWRTYAEYGWGYEVRAPDVMEPGRAQAGLEFEQEGATRGFVPFAAVDFSVFEEDDWEPNLAVIAGLMRRSPSATWRFGVEFTDGRSPVGEFAAARESALALGVWIDL
jgi:Protein of unknown function (DUF1207)